jgi:hypothetical protein
MLRFILTLSVGVAIGASYPNEIKKVLSDGLLFFKSIFDDPGARIARETCCEK